MTSKFKEIDLSREFEYADYDYKIPCGRDGLKVLINFYYYPETSTQVKHSTTSQVTELKRSTELTVTNIYLADDPKQDIYYIVDDFIIKKIEKNILEDLMK